jgi:hypothetical protein
MPAFLPARFSTKKRPRLLKEQGFSLVAVTALGVVCMMWLFAMSASVLPMFQRAASGRFTAIMRSSAEAGLDWAVSQLNASISAGAITSGLVDGAWHAVPSNAIGNNGATVSIKVKQIAPPTTSAIYESYSNSANWYVVTGKADYAGMEKKIRVVLAPNYLPGSGANPYFQFAVFGQKSVGMSGNAVVDGYNYGSSVSNPYGGSNVDALGGNVGSNANPRPSSGAPVSLSGNSTIDGSLLIYQTGTTTLASGSGNAQIMNQLVDNGSGANGNSSGFNSSNVKNQGAHVSPTRNFGGASAPAIINQTNPTGLSGMGGSSVTPPPPSPLGGAYNLAPAQGIPSSATVVNPTITQTGTGGNAVYTVAQPSSGTVANLSAFSQSGNVVWKIPPGDYEMSSLSTSGNGQISLIPGSNGQYGLVRFFVLGNSSSNAVQISGNGVVNGSSIPGNFQIWYSGSQNIQLSGNGSLFGTVYAPKANISISGNGAIYGAIVGYTISDSGNGNIHFDQSLSNPTNQWASYSTQTLGSLQTITWQEPRSYTEENSW